MILRDIHFQSIEFAFLFLGLIPLLALFFLGQLKQQKEFNLLFPEKITNKKSLKIIMFSLGVSFAIIALMQPVVLDNNSINDPKQLKSTTVKSMDLYFIVDTSLSMGVKDGLGGAARLERAKEIADLLLSKDRRDAVSLFSLSNTLSSIVPLNFDPIFTRLVLSELTVGEGDLFGTNFVTSLEKLKEIVEEKQFKSTSVAFLFSDGGDSLNSEKSIKEAAGALKIPIFTVGVGSLKGGVVPDVLENGKKVVVPLIQEPLDWIAKATGGKYFQAEGVSAERTSEALYHQLEEFRSKISLQNERKEIFEENFSPYFQVPLFISMILFLCLILKFRGGNVLLNGFLLFFAFPLLSIDQGEVLFEARQYSEAIKWYQEELKKYPPLWLQDKLFYNLSITLMKEKNWQEANLFLKGVSKEGYQYKGFEKKLKIANELIEKELKENIPSYEERLQNSNTPKEYLLPLMEMTLKYAQDEDLNLKELEEKAFHFFEVTNSWQKQEFKKGNCLCYPWHEAIPLFDRAVQDIKAASLDKEHRHIFLMAAFWRMYETLETLKGALFSGMSLEDQSSLREDVQDLQKMQQDDMKKGTNLKKKKENLEW